MKKILVSLRYPLAILAVSLLMVWLAVVVRHAQINNPSDWSGTGNYLWYYTPAILNIRWIATILSALVLIIAALLVVTRKIRFSFRYYKQYIALACFIGFMFYNDAMSVLCLVFEIAILFTWVYKASAKTLQSS